MDAHIWNQCIREHLYHGSNGLYKKIVDIWVTTGRRVDEKLKAECTTLTAEGKYEDALKLVEMVKGPLDHSWIDYTFIYKNDDNMYR